MHSSSRKRMRLSSPTFDDQVGELSQHDIDAFDCLDAQLSQSFARQPSCTAQSMTHRLPVEDDDNPFRSDGPQAERIHAPFVSALVVSNTIESSQPANEPSDEAEPPDEPSPEVDYAAWFNSDSSKPLAGFATATTAMPGFQRPSINGENTKTLFTPSAATLRVVEEKMRKWHQDVHLPDPVPAHKEFDSPHPSQLVSPPRATFSSARHAFSSMEPETPTPASFSEPTTSSLQSLGSKRQLKPFRSPLISATPSMLSHRLAPTPSIGSPLRGYNSSAVTPSQTATPVSPLRPSSVANHVVTQPLSITPRHRNTTTRPKFVTPFKAILRSDTQRAFVIENEKPAPALSHPRTIVNRVYPPLVPSSPRPSKRNSNARIFDLTSPTGRQTLATSGLRPQAYSAKELEDMGINFKELSQVSPRTAPFYAFATRSHSPSNPPTSSSPRAFGRSAVLEELHAKGCTLATQVWVDNHWPLVLWKLAGMVALDPTSESDVFRKRWCWPEVIRQLMYRYERDLNSSSRPPLRLITTRDASADSPMVLCISDIIWPVDGSEGDTPPYPELEVTDGWYRLRARIDAPLARGVRKGKIKIGRKVSVAGAKLSAERKEGSEILEAYNSNVLLLTGNSTHMAPWHAKLGFQREPFVATLNSLITDGGNVAVMMLTVVKAYPVAYIEFVEDADGRKQREGPHDAREELKLSTQWKTERESHASRLWSEYEKRRYRLLDYAERLEQRAGSKFRPKHDDGPPDKIYDMYDTLQEDTNSANSTIMSTDHEDADWLARHIRERTIQEQDEVSKEIEQELESICPPRDVKAFCVIVVKDTRTYKHPSKRTGQVTVWDVPGVSVFEGYTQSPFAPGQRYVVTNLVPTQVSAWMDCASGGEVYLSTRKNSKWTLVN